MTSLRSIGAAAALALQLAQCGCASEPAHDASPFYLAPRQDAPAPASSAPGLGRHGGGRMQNGAPSPDGSGSDDTIPGGAGPHSGGSLSVGGGGS